MKRILFLALVILPLIAFTGCNTDDDDFPFSEVLGTYVGGMNITDPDFTNAQHTVVVSQVSSSVIKITPSGVVGSEWTAHVTKIAGVYTCISCALSNQIIITDIGTSSIQLTYSYDNNNEQFVGAKQ